MIEEQNMIMQNKCMGMLLGTTVGDVLGSSVEGYSREKIKSSYGELRDFIDTADCFGCYTDDTEMTLALAQSMVDRQGVDGAHCAMMYAGFYNPFRGYGGGAHGVLKTLKSGTDYKETGYLSFKDGSFGNGGAMRIAPLGLVYYQTDNDTLKKLVFEAVRCTHVHPEGIDGAVIQARAVALMTDIQRATDFNPNDFLESLYEIATTAIMKENLLFLRSLMHKRTLDEEVVLRLGNGIRASEAVSCALLAAVRYYAQPEEAVIKSVNFGGDTDTIGAMTGALMGALHGDHWIPARWLDNIENGTYGKDYIIQLAPKLAKLTTALSKTTLEK
jgi:poly(ADP-ribose) glycohydrolase ARH3